MKLRDRGKLRALAVVMIAALLTAMLPGSALAATFSAKVTSKKMPVYVNCNGKVRKASLPKDTVVKVEQVRKGVALFRYNGYYCLGQMKNMDRLDADDAPEEPTTVVKAVAKVATYAFQKPSLDSAYVKVRKGTMVNVLAIKGSVAQVQKGGVVAYMYRPHLLLEGEEPSDGDSSDDEPKKPGLPSFEDAYKSGKYSNEQLCYLFLTQVMGYNTAATAGVLANINYESGFKVTLRGDSGTSYGICQWHASRKTRLVNYCKSHSLDSSTLLGQLAYLKYELETYYPKVHHYLQGVSNTADGAYDAGYYFCYNFEGPAARESQSVTRGQSARKTYFSRYASI